MPQQISWGEIVAAIKQFATWEFAHKKANTIRLNQFNANRNDWPHNCDNAIGGIKIVESSGIYPGHADIATDYLTYYITSVNDFDYYAMLDNVGQTAPRNGSRRKLEWKIEVNNFVQRSSSIFTNETPTHIGVNDSWMNSNNSITVGYDTYCLKYRNSSTNIEFVQMSPKSS